MSSIENWDSTIRFHYRIWWIAKSVIRGLRRKYKRRCALAANRIYGVTCSVFRQRWIFDFMGLHGLDEMIDTCTIGRRMKGVRNSRRPSISSGTRTESAEMNWRAMTPLATPLATVHGGHLLRSPWRCILIYHQPNICRATRIDRHTCRLNQMWQCE